MRRFLLLAALIVSMPTFAHAYLVPLLGLAGIVSSGFGLIVLSALSVLMIFAKPIIKLFRKNKEADAEDTSNPVSNDNENNE